MNRVKAFLAEHFPKPLKRYEPATPEARRKMLRTIFERLKP